MKMPKKGRRSSILKTPRNPLSNLTCVDIENDFTENIKTRRVSFANANVIQKFATDGETNTIWFDKYEESLNQTTSSQNSTLKQTNTSDNSNDGLNCTRLDFEISPERNVDDDNVSLGSGCMDLTSPAIENPKLIETNPFDIKNEKRRTIRFDPNTNNAYMDESEICVMIPQGVYDIENIPPHLLTAEQNPQMDESISQMDLTEIIENKIEISKDLSLEIDKENIAPVIKIIATEQIEMDIIEKLPQNPLKRQTIHFHNHPESGMDLTDRIVINNQVDLIDKENIPILNQQMEFTERLYSKPSRQTIHYQNHEMEITEKLPVHPGQFAEHLNKYRKTIHDYNEMDLTEQLHPEDQDVEESVVHIKIPVKSRQTIHYRDNQMDLSEKLPAYKPTSRGQENMYSKPSHHQENEMEFTERISCNARQNFGEANKRQTIHYNCDNEMDLTEKLTFSNPTHQNFSRHIDRPHEQTDHHNPFRQIENNQEIEMDVTERIPKNVMKPRQTIHYNNYKMDLTEKLPPTRRRSEDDNEEIDFTQNIPAVHNHKMKSRQTIHYANQEGEMDLTEKLPTAFEEKIPFNTTQNMKMKSRQTIHYNNREGKMDLTEQSFNPFKQTLQSNQEMDFTERSIYDEKENEIETTEFPIRSKKTVHRHDEIEMELTEKLPLKNNPSRQTIHYRNQENDMEFTEKLPSRRIDLFRQKDLDQEIEMEFTDKLPLKSNNPFRQTIHHANQNEMEFTEKLPSQKIESSTQIDREIEMDFTERVSLKSNKCRQTIHFNNQDIDIDVTENLQLKSNNVPDNVNYSKQGEFTSFMVDQSSQTFNNKETEKITSILIDQYSQTENIEEEINKRIPIKIGTDNQALISDNRLIIKDDHLEKENQHVVKDARKLKCHNEQMVYTVDDATEMNFTGKTSSKITIEDSTEYDQKSEILPENQKMIPFIEDTTEMKISSKITIDDTADDKENQRLPEVSTKKSIQIIHSIEDETEMDFTEKISSKIEDKEKLIKTGQFNSETTYDNQFRELAMKYQLQSTKLPDEEIISFNKTGSVNRRSINYNNSDNSKMYISELDSIGDESICKKHHMNNESTDNLCTAIKSIQFNKMDDRRYQQLSIDDLQLTNLQQTQNSICFTENLTRYDNTIGLINYKIDIKPGSEYSKIISEDIDTEILKLNETKCLDTSKNTEAVENMKVMREEEGNKNMEIEIERNGNAEREEGVKGKRSLDVELEIDDLRIEKRLCMEIEVERNSNIEQVNEEKERINIVNDGTMEIDKEEIRNMKIVNDESKNITIVIEENKNVENEENQNENSENEKDISLREVIKQMNYKENESMMERENISLDSSNDSRMENKNDSLCLLSDSLLNETHEFTSNDKQTVNKTYVIQQDDFNKTSKTSDKIEVTSKVNKSCIFIESSVDSSCSSSMSEKNLSKAESKSEYSNDYNNSDCMIIENDFNIKKSFDIDYSFLKNEFCNNIKTLREELKNELDVRELNEHEISLEIEKQYDEKYGRCKTPEEIEEEKKVRNECNNVIEDAKTENKIKSYMDKIKEMSMWFPSWKIVKLGMDLVDFTTLDERFLFEVKFDSVTGIVTNISFYSLSQSDEIRPYEKYVYEVFYKKITISYIVSSCGNNYTILSLLDFVTLQVEEMEKIIKEFEDLSVKYGVNIDENLNVNLTFRSFRLRWLFEVEFNLMDMDDISSEKIRFKISSAFKNKDMRLNDIKSFVTEKPKDYKFLRAYIESVNTFIEMLEKKNKK